MPIATIIVLRGHPSSAVGRLLRESSAALADLLAAPIERVQVRIEEIDPEHHAIAGESAAVLLETRSRADVECPLVRLSLIEGRSPGVVAQAIEGISTVVAESLGARLDRVRVIVDAVPPERWGIGGVPASALGR